MPYGHTAERLPRGGQVEHLVHDLRAEHGRGDPRRAEPLGRESDEQVLRPRHRRRRGTGRARTRGGARPGSGARRRRARGTGSTTTGASRSTSPRRSRRATDVVVVAVEGAQVGLPARGHRVEQPRAQRGSRSTTKRQGVVWCGLGAVTAAATARRSASASTGSSVKLRTVRRPSTASRRPSAIASAVPSRNRSSSGRRTSARAPGPSSSRTKPPSPRTTATGAPPSLPFTSSAAAAISSATAVTVISRVLPCASTRPRWSSSTQHAGSADRGVGDALAPRPTERVGDDDARGVRRWRLRSAARSARALASGSTGSSTTVPAGVLRRVDAGGGHHQPVRVSTMRVVPRASDGSRPPARSPR